VPPHGRVRERRRSRRSLRPRRQDARRSDERDHGR
jgi:hypothetical protein